MISAQLVGGVKFTNMSKKLEEYDFNDMESIKDKSTNKRSSIHRSPLEVKRDSKVAKV